MDLRTRTMLLCAAFAVAITVSILLQSTKRRRHYLLSAFSATVALWYEAQSLFGFFRADVWYRITAVLAVLLPQFALRLLDSIIDQPTEKPSKLLRVATVLGVPVFLLAVSPYQAHAAVRTTIFIYVFGLVAAGLARLALRGKKHPSRWFENARACLPSWEASLSSSASVTSSGSSEQKSPRSAQCSRWSSSSLWRPPRDENG
jgi:drug/metabolite transporter (DMT)-like permease